MSGRIIPTISGEGAGISRNWITAHFWPLMIGFRTVMMLVGGAFSLLTCHSENMLRLKV